MTVVRKVMYQEIKPSKGSDNLIDAIWTFSSDEASERFKVLPDTCVDLIFDLSNDSAFLSGVMTKYQLIELASKVDLIGVRFKIEKFGFLSQIPLEVTKNLRVELSELWPVRNMESLKQLSDLGSKEERVDFLERFVEASFVCSLQKQDELVIAVAEQIRALQGIVNIGDLAKTHHLSLRQLERRFKRYVGLTAKQFSNIVRFCNAKKSIAMCTDSSLSEIAFDRGFFDHSHMTYEFQRIAGESPSSFR